MKTVATILLVLTLSAYAHSHEQLVVSYNADEKTGYFCHVHDGKTECRTNRPKMEFPSSQNPEKIISDGGTVCTLENGKMECASEEILSQRQMPDELLLSEHLQYWNGWLCGIRQSELYCYNDKKLTRTALPESGKVVGLTVARDYLAAYDQSEIRFWNDKLELKGRVPVPPHDHLVVLDALQTDGPPSFTTALYCYTHGDRQLTCQIGRRTVSQTLKLPAQRLLANYGRVCAVQEDSSGLRMECFNRYGLRNLRFTPYAMGKEENLREIDDRGHCGLTVEDRLVCWFTSFVHVPAFSLKNAHFLPQPNENLSCLVAPDGGGCAREYGRTFDSRPRGHWAYNGLGNCEVDAQGIRTCDCEPDIHVAGCHGGSFTFASDLLGKVKNITGYYGIAAVTETGVRRAYGAEFRAYPKDVWAHEWKSSAPVAFDYGSVYDGGEIWQGSSSSSTMTPWPTPIKFLGGPVTQLFSIPLNGKDSLCTLAESGTIFCYDKATGQMTLEWADHPPVSQLSVGYGSPSGFFCFVTGRDVQCVSGASDHAKKEYSLEKYYPVVATDREAYYLRRRSGEVVRFDFWKGGYEILGF